jgi:hypothetical protein
MQHLSEFIPLAVATLNLITALIAQRAARRRRERQERGDCGGYASGRARSTPTSTDRAPTGTF